MSPRSSAFMATRRVSRPAGQQPRNRGRQGTEQLHALEGLVTGFLKHRSLDTYELLNKPHSNDVRECKNDLATSQSDAFAASGFRLASDIFGLTAESGLNSDLISPEQSRSV